VLRARFASEHRDDRSRRREDLHPTALSPTAVRVAERRENSIRALNHRADTLRPHKRRGLYRWPRECKGTLLGRPRLVTPHALHPVRVAPRRDLRAQGERTAGKSRPGVGGRLCTQ
jgi:hypothetical protein